MFESSICTRPAWQRTFLKWLGEQGRVTELWPEFMQWLRGSTRQPILNSGLIGGRSAVMVPFLTFMARSVRAFWLRPTLASNWSMDMLLVNQVKCSHTSGCDVQADADGLSLSQSLLISFLMCFQLLPSRFRVPILFIHAYLSGHIRHQRPALSQWLPPSTSHSRIS